MDELISSTPQEQPVPQEQPAPPQDVPAPSPWEGYDPFKEFNLPESRQDEKVYFDALFLHAKELELNPKQAQALAQFQLNKQEEYSKQWQEQEQKQLQETKQSLQQAWGDAYDQKLNRIQAFLKTEASPELYEKITTTAVGQDKDVLLLLDKMSERLSGSPYIGTQGSSTPEPLPPTMSQAWQQAVAKNPEYREAIMNHAHPRYNEAKERWNSLASAYAGK